MCALTRRVVGLHAPQTDRAHLREMRRVVSKPIEPCVTAGPESRRPAVLANAQREYEVTREELPLSCPMPQMPLWSSHPRVYLPIEETGWAMCPYCSAEYRLRR
jgi:uncharacterized Zn-finger protein